MGRGRVQSNGSKSSGRGNTGVHGWYDEFGIRVLTVAELPSFGEIDNGRSPRKRSSRNGASTRLRYQQASQRP
jgi:hypothetical protein